MAAPALKDLPKVAVDLKSQLESFSPDQLKNASTEEKALLPTAEGNIAIIYHQKFMNQLSFVSEWFTDPHLNLHKFFPANVTSIPKLV